MIFHAHRLWLGLGFAIATAAMAQEEQPRPVTVVTAERSPLVTRMELTGSITARRQANLSARTDGLIHQLHVDAGDVVTAGQVLMELDNELAGLALERVIVERQQAEVEYEDARRLADEARQLAEDGAFPRSQAASRETSLRIAETGFRRSQVLEKEQRALVERHRLIAPFDGVVAGKLAEEGEWVQTGTPVVQLVETTGLRMDVQAPQEIYAHLTGMPAVVVRLDAYPEQAIQGKIAAIVPVNDAVTRTFLARIEMNDPAGLAAPGMSGRVAFEFRGDKDVIQLPRDAVIRFPDGTAKVWVVSGGRDTAVASARDIKLGQTLTEVVEILDGIDAGDLVVLRGNEGLREGQRLELLPDQPGASSERR